MTLAVLDLAQDTQGVIDSWSCIFIASLPRRAMGCLRCNLWPVCAQTANHLWLSLASADHADFELTSANADERDVARDLLDDKRDLCVIGDKGFISAPLAHDLKQRSNSRLLTLPRRNQKVQVPREVRRLINQVRQMIETVNGQLTEQFQIETNHAHSFWGLCARLYTKLAAHMLCISLNRLLGNRDWLRIKPLAYPA